MAETARPGKMQGNSTMRLNLSKKRIKLLPTVQSPLGEFGGFKVDEIALTEEEKAIEVARPTTLNMAATGENFDSLL